MAALRGHLRDRRRSRERDEQKGSGVGSTSCPPRDHEQWIDHWTAVVPRARATREVARVSQTLVCVMFVDAIRKAGSRPVNPG
jgi:hypothetical protein